MPGAWCMEHDSMGPPPSCLKASFDQRIGNMTMIPNGLSSRPLASSVWDHKSIEVTPRSPVGQNNIEQQLLDRASKRGKGQQPILVGALYRGNREHAALKAGDNDMVQLKVAQVGLATTSEKYVAAQSAHTQVRFIAVTWENLPALASLVSEEESDDIKCRSSRRNWTAPKEPRESD